MNKVAPQTARRLPRSRWTLADGLTAGDRAVAEETPVAIVHDGSTTAVMMATPADLEDFAVGFSLSEGIIATPADIRDLDIVESDLGIELRLWLSPACSNRLAARRRRIVGPTGCGLCGIDSLDEATKPPRPILDRPFSVTPEQLLEAMSALEQGQTLGRETRAVHAAGFWRQGEPILVREDVGRHNALDKLLGAIRRADADDLGAVLLTSRVSVEMVQKAAVFGAPILCAVSAPTALAIRTAEAAGIALVGIARSDGFEMFTQQTASVLMGCQAK